MKLRTFSAEGLHGYLGFNLAFHPDVTFLTGINGSGKTSVVTGIFALISPSFWTLAKTNYRKITVTLECDQRQVTIWAERTESVFRLNTSETLEPLEIGLLVKEPLAGTSREADEQRQYYREQAARSASHPVMQVIQKLPTPMFLSIERRVADYPTNEETVRYATAWKPARDIFSTLSRSLAEAADLAERKHNAIQSKLRELAADLRKKIILAALKYEPAFGATEPWPAPQKLIQAL